MGYFFLPDNIRNWKHNQQTAGQELRVRQAHILPSWSSLNRKVNDLMSSPPKCQNKPLQELPWASKPCPSPYKQPWLCMGQCTLILAEKQGTNTEPTWICTELHLSYTWHSSPLPRTSLRCHRTCLGGTREHWPLTSSPCGHFWKLLCLWTALQSSSADSPAIHMN